MQEAAKCRYYFLSSNMLCAFLTDIIEWRHVLRLLVNQYFVWLASIQGIVLITVNLRLQFLFFCLVPEPITGGETRKVKHTPGSGQHCRLKVCSLFICLGSIAIPRLVSRKSRKCSRKSRFKNQENQKAFQENHEYQENQEYPYFHNFHDFLDMSRVFLVFLKLAVVTMDDVLWCIHEATYV